MASINKVILIGNVGRDPEMRYTASNLPVCNISLATSRNSKNRESGERQEETEWHRVVLYDRLAEIANEYLRKGRPVYIEGRIRTRKWQDKDGRDVYTTEIIAEQMQLLGGREGSGGGEMDEGSGMRRAPSERPAPRSSAPASRPAPQKSATSMDDMDDDIPF